MGIFQYIVHNPMLTNYYTARLVASTLDSTLKQKRIVELFSQQKDELILSFEAEVPPLVVSCQPAGSLLYLAPHLSRARRNSVSLLPGAAGSLVQRVAIAASDRIVVFSLSNGLRLAAFLFGSAANVFLVDESGIAVDAFKNRRKLVGKHLQFPPEGLPISHDMGRLQQAAADSPGMQVATLIRKTYPQLGATLSHEVAARAALAPGSPASALPPEAFGRLEEARRTVLADCSTPKPRLYLRKDGTPALLSIIPLRHAGQLTERAFDSIHEAIRFFIARRHSVADADRAKEALLGPLKRRLEKARRTLDAVRDDARARERAAQYERYAKLLMANLHASHKGMRSVTLNDDGSDVTIALDPSLAPVQNAQRYFEKAKRARSSTEETVERLHDLEDSLARGEALLAAVEECRNTEEIDRLITERSDEFEALGIGPKSSEQSQIPFRVFTVDGGFEVWAGKNGANNDLLTLRYAKPSDLWFHARGTGGSHVVLKVGTGKGEPGKKAREQAAGIAAYYSKMKGSRMVPVAMTEKRYVRKPRGSPPGTVIIEREKVIFAAPALPAQSRHEDS